MQSSTGVVFRAIVMLACLVAIPLIAMFGRSLPELFTPVRNGGQRPSLPLAHNPTNGPSQFEPTVATQLQSGPVPFGVTTRPSTPSVVAVGYNGPAAPAERPRTTAGDVAARGTTDRFTLVDGRLRELGATHCLLESWGDAGLLYRFRCEVALGENPGLTRHFEATDPHASQAMAEVLQQVETWRTGPRISQ